MFSKFKNICFRKLNLTRIISFCYEIIHNFILPSGFAFIVKKKPIYYVLCLLGFAFIVYRKDRLSEGFAFIMYSILSCVYLMLPCVYPILSFT